MDTTEHTLFCRHCTAPFAKPTKRNFPSCFCSKRCFRLCKDYGSSRLEFCCRTCGVLFYLYPGHVTNREDDFCSKECAHQFYTREFICMNCHVSFRLKRSRAEEGGGKFCSMKCQHALARATGKERTCLACGVLFVAIRFQRNRKGDWSLRVRDNVETCSPGCSHKIRHVNFGGGKRFVGREATNWQGGRSQFLVGYRGPGWKKRADKVRKTAKYCCEHCGKSQEENGRTLDVNHIIPWFNFTDHRKANASSNLEALCRSCHLRAEPRTNDQQVFTFMNGNRRRIAGYIPKDALFTREEVVFFRDAYDNGTTPTKLAKQFHVERGVMWRMVTRRSYRYVC